MAPKRAGEGWEAQPRRTLLKEAHRTQVSAEESRNKGQREKKRQMFDLNERTRFLSLGIGISVTYWLIEAFADYAWGEGPVVTRLLPADANEIWMRLIIVALIMGLALQASRTLEERKRSETSLRRTEERYRSIFENAVDGIFQTALNGHIIVANPAAARIFGYDSPEEMIAGVTDVGRQIYVDLADRGRIDELIRQNGAVHDLEIQMCRRDGTRIWVSLNAHALRDDNGRLAGYEGSLEDVTQRKRANEALRESEARYRAVVEQVADGLYLVDIETLRIIDTNPSFRAMFGYTAEELQDMEVYDLIVLSREEIASSMLRTLEAGRRFVGERSYRRRDGRCLDVEVSASVIFYGGRKVACVLVQDITERKRSEVALREVREAERRQIARDLHDGVLQELMDALYSMEVTRLKLRNAKMNVPEIDDQIEDLQKATQALREGVKNLRRSSIHEQPFLLLLRSVVAANRQKSPQIEIDLEVDASFASEFVGSTGVELLRIVQEALVNARRHSEARHILVRIEGGENLTVEVVDDGRGFDPDIDPEATWDRVGISGMRERAFKLGGELDIHSSPGQGTRVTVRVPVMPHSVAGDLNVRGGPRGERG